MENYSKAPTRNLIQNCLVGGFNLSEKYEFVSWDDYSQLNLLNGKINMFQTNQLQFSGKHLNNSRTDTPRLGELLAISIGISPWMDRFHHGIHEEKWETLTKSEMGSSNLWRCDIFNGRSSGSDPMEVR